MARDWNAILEEFQADYGTALIARLHDDDGIFEALWSFVAGSAELDVRLADAMTKGTALAMLLRLASSLDEVCHALLMNKENSFPMLLHWAKKSGNDVLILSAETAMLHNAQFHLDFKFPGTDLEHLQVVKREIDDLPTKFRWSDEWYPLRFLHSVLARAMRQNIHWDVVVGGLRCALDIIEGLRQKAERANDVTMARQLERENIRWSELRAQVLTYAQGESAIALPSGGQPISSAKGAGPPAAEPQLYCEEDYPYKSEDYTYTSDAYTYTYSTPVTGEVPGMGLRIQPGRKQSWDAGHPPSPSSPARKGAPAWRKGGQGAVGDANAREVERLLVDAAVQGEQQLRDHLLALVAPDLRADSKQTLQEFHQIKCLVTDPGGVGALLRFGESLARWVASPDEGLGGHDRHLTHVCKGLRAFADGLDEGLGAEEKHDIVIRAFATVGSKPGFRQPRSSALVLGDIVECLDHAGASAGPVSSAVSRAACILASVLTGGYPGQEATDADAVSTFGELLRRIDNGVPPLQKFFHLLIMMKTKAREAMAHVLLILLECTGEESQHAETISVLVSADARLRNYLKNDLSNVLGPWTLRLGLWLRRALKDIPGLQVTLTEHPLLASLMDDRPFLLAAVPLGSGGPLSLAAASVLFGVQLGWWDELAGLTASRLIQVFVSRLVPHFLGDALSSLDEDQRAALFQALVTHCALYSLQAKQSAPLMMLMFLVPSETTLSHQLVTDAEGDSQSVTRIVRTYLEKSVQEESHVEDLDVWSPDTLNGLNECSGVHMGSVVAGLVCRCLVQPSRRGVTLVLLLALKVLSTYFEPHELRRLDNDKKGEAIAVLEAVLGLLEKGRPRPTCADPQVLHALCGMSDLVNLIRKYAYEARTSSNLSLSSKMEDVLHVATAILRHLGAAGSL